MTQRFVTMVLLTVLVAAAAGSPAIASRGAAAEHLTIGVATDTAGGTSWSQEGQSRRPQPAAQAQPELNRLKVILWTVGVMAGVAGFVSVGYLFRRRHGLIPPPPPESGEHPSPEH